MSEETPVSNEHVVSASEASQNGKPQMGAGMTELFVRRPVLAFVINMLIIVAGLAAFAGIEIRELPDVDRPVVTINSDYDGAAAETMDREVTDVIERAV